MLWATGLLSLTKEGPCASLMILWYLQNGVKFALLQEEENNGKLHTGVPRRWAWHFPRRKGFCWEKHPMNSKLLLKHLRMMLRKGRRPRPRCYKVQFGQFCFINTLLFASTTSCSTYLVEIMGNKAPCGNLAEEGLRRDIKKQHLLNCSVYKMEAARPKAGSTKGKRHGGKRTKNIWVGRIIIQNLPTKWLFK